MRTIALEEHFVTAELVAYGASTADIAPPEIWERASHLLLDVADERLAIMEAHRDRLIAQIEELSGFLERIESKVEGYRAYIEERKLAVR